MNRKVNIVFCCTLLVMACSHYDDILKNFNQSKEGATKSHNQGQNCMNCHNDNYKLVSHNNWWNIAGTVYRNASQTADAGFVELWTDTNRSGELLYRLPIDAKGNFYTNNIIDFKDGFYPVLIYSDGTYNPDNSMLTKTKTGACNSCHDGKTQEQIILY